MSKNRRRPHRGRREKKKKAGMLSNIILIVALAVFCVSAFQLVKIVGGYAKGRDEYKKIQSIAINKEDSEPEKGFSVDFDELKGINPDTVGWIRFYPEPSIINYPIVQTTDNEKYLEYSFILNSDSIKKLRKYNKDRNGAGGYIDNTLRGCTITDGFYNCSSSFLDLIRDDSNSFGIKVNKSDGISRYRQGY